MLRISRRALPVLALALIASGGPAAAQTAATVEGFRSARFQMTEDQVRKAIESDFKGAKIEKRTSSVTRTVVLSIKVPDLIPDRGTAQVNYTFGYKSSRLMQVDLIWNKAIDNKLTAEQLIAVQANLRELLQDRGFKKEKTVSNATTDRPDVILFFRAEDDEGRMVAMVGRFEYDAKAEEGKRLKMDHPESVVLSYIQSPKTPDVFKLERGKF